jgi:hypothetical protein
MEGQYFSQFGEDKWIVDNLHYPLNGVFVDVGASDGVYGNNTYFFEKIGEAYVSMLIPVIVLLYKQIEDWLKPVQCHL